MYINIPYYEMNVGVYIYMLSWDGVKIHSFYLYYYTVRITGHLHHAYH